MQVKILDGRLLPQTGTPQPCRQGPILLLKAFPVHEKTETFLKHQIVPLRTLLLFLQGLDHAEEAQGFQRFNCRMQQHGAPPWQSNRNSLLRADSHAGIRPRLAPRSPMHVPDRVQG